MEDYGHELRTLGFVYCKGSAEVRPSPGGPPVPEPNPTKGAQGHQGAIEPSKGVRTSCP